MKGFCKLRWMFLIGILLGSSAQTLWAQDVVEGERGENGTTIAFSLIYGDVVFTADGKWRGPNSAGVIKTGDHSNDNVYIIRTKNDGVNAPQPTTHTITIETPNLVAGSTIAGNTYKITLDNVYIDRSGEPHPLGYATTSSHGETYTTISRLRSLYADGLRMPFNAGDNTVEVEITLENDNILLGEPGVNAVIQYNDYHYMNGNVVTNATVGNKKLTIKGDGSLTLRKDGTMNSGACIGCSRWGTANDNNIANGTIVIEGSPTITASTGGVYDWNGLGGAQGYYNTEYGNYGAAIGAGASCRSGNITINGGTITVTTYATPAAIGGGGGWTAVGAHASGNIVINGGDITTYCKGNYLVHEMGVGIGGGSANQNGGGDANNITINGGTVNVWKWEWEGTTMEEYEAGHWVRGDIGGGNSNTQAAGSSSSKGGDANITIKGGTVNAGNLGGGSGSQPGASGGYANLTVNMTEGEVNLTGNIGGGNSVYTNGGNATINFINGTLSAGSIGGGNCLGNASANPPVPGDGNGGTASVTVKDGTLTISGKIGGGYSAGAGAGGNASIYVTGGTFDCGSIGGGDSNTGAPGSVSASVSSSNPLGAGIYIAGDSKITVKSGYIGGGVNTAGDIGKATAYIKASHAESTIQGQFILCNNTSTTSDHSFFILEDGMLDNTHLGAIGAAQYPRMMAEGGAVFMEDAHGEVRISGGTIKNATGTLGGAIYMSNGSFTMSGGTIGGTTLDDANVASNNGGALYMGGGSFLMTGGSIQYNKATSHDGGGIYIADGGTVTIKGGNIEGNQALRGNGGGFYVNPGSGNTTTIKSDVANTTITGNKAKNGGGAYVAGGALYVASTNGKTTSICDNTATVNGGGFYAGSNVEVVSGTICDNSAVNGAGLYSASGNVEVTSNSSITGNTASADGGGIYAAGGHVTVNPGNVSVTVLSDNHADNGNGGAIYAGGGNVGFQNGTITLNSANNGGAIYANGGTVTFRDGFISNNYATARGGGLYITESGNLALQGTAVLTRNHVPSSGEGGGVYLAGVVHVGTEGGTSSSPKSDAIIAEDNFADDDPDAVVIWTNRNNIFLPKPRVNAAHKDVVSIYAYGMSLNSGSGIHTHVGFSVPRNFVPVIYCSDWQYLRNNKSALVATVFDDSELYFTVWNSELPYNKNYIYLSGLLWPEVVYEWPLTGYLASGFEVDANGDVTIRSKAGFAWLISYVNGRTDEHPFDPHDMDGKKVTIDLAEGENLDMHQYGWVPIGYGESGKEFKGEFEGNGASISGIVVIYGNDQGVFGDVTGNAKISNTFISNTALSNMRYDTDTYYMGGLACRVGDNAEVVGCGANGPMECLEPATGVVMGGLVGKLYGNAKIQSCYATPEMDGYTMGGLVGEMVSGTVENCFTYPKFVAYDANTAYIGGLVAEMTDGKFENCFTHEQAGSSHGTEGKFGWFAGNYTAGEFNYCYAPENDNYIHPTSTGTLNATGYGYFEPTALVNGKYGFKHQDQDVTKAVDEQTNDYIENGIVDENGNLKGLLATLNNWVDAQGSGTNYASWMRTMGSHINLDLPVLEYKGEACLGSETGAIIYSKDVNDLLGDFLDGDIYLYGTNPKQVSKSTKTNVRLYIKPNVGILQDASASLNARVGILLDNSNKGPLGGEPYDWHMFSTPLNNAPLGLTYNPNGVSYTPAYGIDPPQVAIGSGCYFPTNTLYGAPYTSDGSFDYYCYSEKDCHWINFKRDSNDHWRQDEPHDYIDYNDINNQGTAGNEATLIPGKGYMLAVSYPTMVMADGRLNNGTVTYKATNSNLSGWEAPLKGVNLIGNPYQSYLDFDKFVNGNIGISGNTYYILDADSSKYLAYTAGSTDNGIGAPGYLHPHQGFFVRVADAQTTLEFTNAMRSVEGNADTHFRGERPAYPLVNMVCTDAKGMMDYATIELNRPEQGGGQKIGGLRTGDASVWFHLDDEDWQTAFTREGLQTAPLRFEAHADGTYTMRWNTLNGDFSYLHLVDNMTGTDTDCLLTEEYRFTATTHDYLSRFTLVFECTGVEENGPSTGSESFAFMMGDELVVNGEGMLQVYDMSGRLLAERELHGTQSTVSLPRVSNGMYLLRLRSASQVRVQKMVINK